MRFVRTSAVGGKVTIGSGALPAGTQVTLSRVAPRGASTNALTMPDRTRPPDATGNFQFTGVLPGRYRVVARAMATSANALWDGTFVVTGHLAGTYGVAAPTVPPGWRLRSVVVNGLDVLDFPLEFGLAGDVAGAVVTFTDRRTDLSGSLQAAANVPAPDYFVVAVPADRAYWRQGARRMQFTPASLGWSFPLSRCPGR